MRHLFKKGMRTGLLSSPEQNDTAYSTVVANLLIALYRNQDKPVGEKLGFAGGNTGNLIFTEAVKEQVNYQKEIWINPAALESVKHPSVIIPAANFIIAGENDSLALALIRFMDATDCPVTMAGLGAQGSKELNTPRKLVNSLTETKKKCFKMLGERAVSLGIRGEFTAECLDILGIHNYRIIGCPSLYKTFSETYLELPKPTLQHVQITVTPADPAETRILQMGYSMQADWMMQMSTDLIEYAAGEKILDSAVVQNSFWGIDLNVDQMRAYIKDHGVFCWSKEQWSRFYTDRRITFAFGSRFHGNMAALRNGVPALWITHDSRTTELIDVLNLPCITRKFFMERIKTPEQLLEYCNYEKFYRKYARMLKNYMGFLQENHIERTAI